MICTCHLLLWSLTALVQFFEPSNVMRTHLLSITKGNIGIGDRDHGGLAILGESSSTIARQDCTELLDLNLAHIF